MALSNDPTKTRAIERRWFREIARRWREFTGEVVPELAAGGPDFMLFYNQEIARILVESPEPPDWQSKYQVQAYARGIQSTNASIRREGFQLTEQDGTDLLIPFLLFGVASSAVFGQQVHTDELEFLTGRSHAALTDTTSALSRQTRQILMDGVRQGKSEAELIAEVRTRIGVSKSSAERIARTETIQAFQRAAINQAAILSGQLDEDVQLRWVSQNDSVVRSLHRRWHGQIFSREQAMININVSPWNCRCKLEAVVVPNELSSRRRRVQFKRDNKRFDRERKALLAKKVA